jgi:hypothetical protein
MFFFDKFSVKLSKLYHVSRSRTTKLTTSPSFIVVDYWSVYFGVKHFFSENAFRWKYFSMFGTYGKLQIFFIFSFSNINL